MPQGRRDKGPAKRKGESPIREVADEERRASSGDTALAPGEERQSERVRPAGDTETDDDVE